MNFDQTIVPKTRKKNKRKSNDESLKVVYISNPMKVKTSASRFRSLVQELTGKHSDVSRYMDDNNHNTDFYHEIDCDEEEDDRVPLAKDDRRKLLSPSVSTPTSSEYSLGGPMQDDNLFGSQMNGRVEGVFSSDSFYDDPTRMDVSWSFDELMYG